MQTKRHFAILVWRAGENVEEAPGVPGWPSRTFLVEEVMAC